METRLKETILGRLKRDYNFRSETGAWMRGGKCPACGAKELYISTEVPWRLNCGRENKCGEEWIVKDLYDDLFDNWSERFQQSSQDPHAAAKAYLRDGRGLNTTKLSGCYTQETYQDWNSRQTTATVRFPIACAYGTVKLWKAGFWERLIDRPQRFGKKKANMPKGWSYRGHVWHHPSLSMDQLAGAKEIWVAEGIFDAVALQHAFDRDNRDAIAITTLSTNNDGHHFFEALRKHCHTLEIDRPIVIFAFDVGAAGVRFTRKYVSAMREAGWTARAAQVRPDGEGSKKDWNDLWQSDELSPDVLKSYLANGDITIAESPAEKAFLLWQKWSRPEFHLLYNNRTYWARLSAEGVNQKLAEWQEENPTAKPTAEMMEGWAREELTVAEIANCAFRTLYYWEDQAVGDSGYYVQVDFPGRQDRVKRDFPGNSITAAGDFKKRLISVAPGGQWLGSTHQLDRIMGLQLSNIRTVDTLYFTGYSRDHGAWMFNDVAVKDGRVIKINDEDFFEIGKTGIKPQSVENFFSINTDANDLSYDWWDDYTLAFGLKGTVTLAFWLLVLFAEQIRRRQQSLAFLEMHGQPGTGKSSCLVFLWKLLGRTDEYEGFDPASATFAGAAREFAKYGNLPTVMLEGDSKDARTGASRFDWNSLKKVYNGHSMRTRGVANRGVSTFEPPFRGGLVIAQNEPVSDTQSAVLERIMSFKFDKSHFSQAGLEAADRLKMVEHDSISGWVIQMTRSERALLDCFWERYDHHRKRLLAHAEVQNVRLAHNHAQLAAAMDCLYKFMKDKGRTVIASTLHAEAQTMITKMCVERHSAINADPPAIADFWEKFDFLCERFSHEAYYAANHGEASGEPKMLPVNLHRDKGMIAVHLASFEARLGDARLSLDKPMSEVRKLLHQSKSRKFVKATPVNCIDGKTRHCWTFRAPEQSGENGYDND